MTKELKPCPLCEGAAEIEQSKNSGGWNSISCTKCNSKMSSFFDLPDNVPNDTLLETIILDYLVEKWNTRTEQREGFLKPCPFCGRKDIIVNHNGSGETSFFCPKCHYILGSGWTERNEETFEKYFKLWNGETECQEK